MAKKLKLTMKEFLKRHGLYRAACGNCNRKSDLESIVASIFEAIVQDIAAGFEVAIHGFGKFSPKTYAGRTQKSGLPGVPGGIAKFDDVKLMKFKLSPMAKRTLNGTGEEKPAKGRKATKVAAPGKGKGRGKGKGAAKPAEAPATAPVATPASAPAEAAPVTPAVQ